ncbi:MAG: phospho-N-acetylmuramoyl-pentapeptide-transferase [Desulfomicrobiaceae bacterium]|nr:phospho-N-acetylmuramoyl-pentapeptide-transferase [Desulfomicrobiaceae bacterium]MDK2873151.1 phospho-N-acetylmuramoyl-pentapeptide-transferase [Desulfomicrobiaceae bacterium]
MIYHLLYPLSDTISVFNVFRYITFRSVYAMVTALVLAIVVGPTCIEWLRRLKVGQYIKECGPDHQQKSGTPTMGGLLYGLCLLVSVFLWADLTNPFIWLCVFVFVGFGLVGLVDDYLKVVRRHNDGLSARGKLLGQVLVALGAVSVLVALPQYSTKLMVPFFKHLQPDLSWLYIPFAVFVLTGSSNAVNLTDGLDGLAIGPAVVCAACFAVFVYVAGHVNLANYLQVAYISGVGEVAVFCGAMVGAGLGFLWFNAYPAQVFMGDVGSLSIGGALGFVAVLCKQELLLAVVGGLFVVETLSVILQVGYFKMTGGRRILRMAPLHHHFEKCGLHESKIIVRFWILSILLAVLALGTLKLR